MDEQIEQDIKAAGADRAPRITPSDIEANIVTEVYFTALDGALKSGVLFQTNSDKKDFVAVRNALSVLTVCVLILRNGFTVVGTSACASPENFNEEIGRKVARQKAVEQVWPLMGYALRSDIARHGIEGKKPPPEEEKFPEDDFPF